MSWKNIRLVIVIILANFLVYGSIGLFVWFCVNEGIGQEEFCKIENVVRIFMHEEGHYSILFETETSELGQETLRSEGGVSFLEDVSPDKKCWVEFNRVTRGGHAKPFWCRGLKIHLHSAKELNGGGWDHGKFGSGQTTIIE